MAVPDEKGELPEVPTWCSFLHIAATEPIGSASKASGGVVITAIEEGSPADRAGLEPSMVVTQVGRKAVKGVADFEAELKNASLDKGVLLLVRTPEGSKFVVLKASE